MRDYGIPFQEKDLTQNMEFHQVPVKRTDFPSEQSHQYGKKPLLPLPPAHMRQQPVPQENVFPVYAPTTFVTYPQEYYQKGIAPPPMEPYIPIQMPFSINGFTKLSGESYPALIADDCPEKSKTDNSTRENHHYSRESYFSNRKDEYKPYSKDEPKRNGNEGSINRPRDNKSNHQSDGHSSDYRSDVSSKQQKKGSSSHRQDNYSNHRNNDNSSHQRDDRNPSHRQDSHSDNRNGDTSKRRRDDHSSHRPDNNSDHRNDYKPKYRRDDDSSRRQTDEKSGYARDSHSPHRKSKYSDNRTEEKYKYSRNNQSPHRHDNYSDYRSDEKNKQRRSDPPSRRQDSYSYKSKNESSTQKKDNSTYHENGYTDHRNTECCKQHRAHSSSKRYNGYSDHRNNDSSNQRRKDNSSHRQDNSSNHRSNDNSKHRNGSYSDQSRDDNYKEHLDDYRDDYDFSTGDYYTYPNNKDIVAVDDQVYLTTDSVGWPFEAESMSSRGSSSAGDLDCKVYVGQIGRGAVKEELEDKFGCFGRIKSVWIARNPPGFAFVVFYNLKDAEKAAEEMDGEIINHRRARVEMSSGKSRWGSAGPPTRRRDSRDGRDSRDSRRQHMYNGDYSRSRSRSPPRYDRYRKYSRSRSRSKSPFEHIYQSRR